MAVKKRLDKRRGPDVLIKTIGYLAVISWILILTLFITVSMAKPKFKGFDKSFNVMQTQVWDTSILQMAFYIMIFQLVLAIFGLLINTSRNRRRTDSFNKSLITSGLLSMLGIILYSIYR